MHATTEFESAKLTQGFNKSLKKTAHDCNYTVAFATNGHRLSSVVQAFAKTSFSPTFEVLKTSKPIKNPINMKLKSVLTMGGHDFFVAAHAQTADEIIEKYIENTGDEPNGRLYKV